MADIVLLNKLSQMEDSIAEIKKLVEGRTKPEPTTDKVFQVTVSIQQVNKAGWLILGEPRIASFETRICTESVLGSSVADASSVAFDVAYRALQAAKQ